MDVAERLIEQAPDNPLAHNLAGGAWFGKGDQAAARASFERALDIDAHFTPALANLAEVDLTQGDLAAAGSRYRAMLAADVSNTRALQGLATVAERDDRLVEAIELLETVRALDPDAAAPQLTLVELYIRSGAPENALVAANRLRGVHGDKPYVLNAVTHAQLATGDLADAAVTLGLMAILASASAPELTRIAALQVTAEHPDGAERSLRKAIFTAPDYVPALKALIELKARSGQLDEALATLNEVRAAHPDIVIDVLVEGDLLMRAGRLDEAAAVFQAGFERQPSIGLLLRLYIARRDGGESARALGLLQEWLAAHPDDMTARRALAVGYIAAGRPDEAVRDLEILVAEQPNDALLLNNLAWLYHERGDARALDYATRAHHLAPDQPATLDTLGWILVMAGETARGLKLLRDAQARASRSPGIRYHLAVALNSLGRTAEARHELEAILESAPASEFDDKARALLSVLPAAE